MLYIVFGPSGSGKTELCKKIRELKDDGENVSIISKATTRKKKPYDGKEIQSFDKKSFEEWCQKNQAYVYECEKSNGYKYKFGISKKTISRNAEGNHCFIICNDINTAKSIRNDFSAKTKVRIIYLFYNAKSETLKQQIAEKITQERKNSSVTDKDIQDRFDRIQSLNNTFENYKHEFDGVIFNQYVPAGYINDSLNKLKKRIYNEIHIDDTPVSVKKDSVFVITPMGEATKETYGDVYADNKVYFITTQEIIKRVCKNHGLNCINLDSNSGENIIENIHSQISMAQYIICDISANRPNCYYEYGLAKSLDKKILALMCNDMTTKIHFDIYTESRLNYTLDNLEQKLNEELDKKLKKLNGKSIKDSKKDFYK